MSVRSVSAAAAAAADRTHLHTEMGLLQQRIQHLSDTAQLLNKEHAWARLTAANGKRSGASLLLKRLLQMEPLLLSLLLLLAVVPALQHQHYSSIVASLNQEAAAERAKLQSDLVNLLQMQELNG